MVASQLPECDRCMGDQPPNGAFLCDQGGKGSQPVSMLCPQNSTHLASAGHTGPWGTGMGLRSVSLGTLGRWPGRHRQG